MRLHAENNPIAPMRETSKTQLTHVGPRPFLEPPGASPKTNACKPHQTRRTYVCTCVNANETKISEWNWVKYMRKMFSDFQCHAHTFHVDSEGRRVDTALQQLGHHVLQQQLVLDSVLAGAVFVPSNKIAACEATPPKTKASAVHAVSVPFRSTMGMSRRRRMEEGGRRRRGEEEEEEAQGCEFAPTGRRMRTPPLGPPPLETSSEPSISSLVSCVSLSACGRFFAQATCRRGR